MSGRRSLLAAVALLAGVVGLWGAIADVTFEDRTCGNALLATDPSTLVVLSGDAAIDDFEGQRLEGSCRRRIQRRRFLVLVPLGVAGAAALTAMRGGGAARR